MSPLIWITGLSGAGKTTLARKLVSALQGEYQLNAILLDGDEVRQALQLESQYEAGERKKIAYIYARLGALLCRQGFAVIVPTISMFEEIRTWNRSQNAHYVEVYMNISYHLRSLRDPKGLYAAKKELVELSEHYEAPTSPDLVFGDNDSLDEMVVKIIDKILLLKP